MPAVLRQNTRLYADTGAALIGDTLQRDAGDFIISGHGITKTTELLEEFGVGQRGFFRVPGLEADCTIPIESAYYGDPSFELEQLAAGASKTRLLSLMGSGNPLGATGVVDWTAGDFEANGLPTDLGSGFVTISANYVQAGNVYRSKGRATNAWRNAADLDTSYGTWDVSEGRPVVVVLITKADNIGTTYVLTARIRIGSTNYDIVLRRNSDGAMRTGIFIADFNDYTGPPAFPSTGTAAARVLFTTGGSDVPAGDRTIGVGIGGRTDI